METFVGYISDDGVEFTIYEITAMTYKSARHRLKRICKGMTYAEGDEYSIYYMLKNGEPGPEVKVIETKKTTA